MTEDRYRSLVGRIKRFSADRDWSQFHDPKNLAISLQLEASEVLELFQWTQDNQLKKGKEKQLENEVADVFYWIIMIANHYEMDIFSALNRKMRENILSKSLRVSLISTTNCKVCLK